MTNLPPRPHYPVGSHIAYWRRQPKPGSATTPTAPLEPLSTRQIIGLIVVAILIASLIFLSVAWWLRALHL